MARIRRFSVALTPFRHKRAEVYRRKLLKRYGRPDSATRKTRTWKNILGVSRVTVKDESILHKSPARHHDYVYSTAKIRVTPKVQRRLVNSSGSIIVDRLKGEVTARCHSVTKNAVTLSFVKDLTKDRLNRSAGYYPREYKRRILGDIITIASLRVAKRFDKKK